MTDRNRECSIHGDEKKTIGLFHPNESYETAYARWAISRGSVCTCERKCETCLVQIFEGASCNRCWEVEHRLEDYLRNGRGNAFKFVNGMLAQVAVELRESGGDKK